MRRCQVGRLLPYTCLFYAFSSSCAFDSVGASQLLLYLWLWLLFWLSSLSAFVSSSSSPVSTIPQNFRSFSTAVCEKKNCPKNRRAAPPLDSDGGELVVASTTEEGGWTMVTFYRPSGATTAGEVRFPVFETLPHLGSYDG